MRTRKHVFLCKFCQIWLTGSRWNHALFNGQKKNKILARTDAASSARIAPKICQGQLQTIYSEFPKFHPNPFPSGGVIAERVNIVQTRHKVFAILGEASASSPSNYTIKLLFMAALWNSAGHYIFALWFLSSSFFPCLISAAADWMSTILSHMVWPYCKFRMQVWNVLHAARLKYRTQKIAKNSPSGHYRTTLSCYIFASSHLRHVSTIRKKLVKQQYLPTCPHDMVNFGLLAAEIDPVV